MASDFRKCGALWAKQNAKGEYFSGKVDAEALSVALASGETQLFIFPVRQKRERGPDFELFTAPPRER